MRHEEDKTPKALARPGWEVSLPHAPESSASARPTLPTGVLAASDLCCPTPCRRVPARAREHTSLLCPRAL